MSTIKTAISIDKSIYEQMDILAKKSKISRSRLYALAAMEFIIKNKNTDLLRLLNAAYKDLPETEPVVAEMKQRHYQLVKDQW